MTILMLDQLCFQFPEREYPAVSHLDLTIERGDFVILLGSNGSGKSTLLKLLNRTHTPPKNKIHFAGRCVTQYALNKYAKQVSLLTQNCSESLFNSLTLYENYLLHSQGNPLKPEALQHYLHDFNPNLCKKLNCLTTALSGGEKQAFALAMCLSIPPQLLLLDEHTSALDPKTSQQIMMLTARKIKEHHITCILTTHDLDIALTYGNKIIVLAEGKMLTTFSYDEKQQLTKEKLLASCF
ncbi:MAG: ATP-binding cassette domain-containing protein [Gammaproteobacteria bacterium]|nr:ATP-binding cassette domain-containing protein [Gammaproteobacteria bacterium]